MPLQSLFVLLKVDQKGDCHAKVLDLISLNRIKSIIIECRNKGILGEGVL